MPKTPNVLILMTDQQRHDYLGCAGNAWLHTPNMDRLAREGVRFTRAYTTSPLCMPARASFVSGQYLHNHHLATNAGMLPAESDTFMRRLQQAGYHTAFVGKGHFYGHGGGTDLRHWETYVRSRGFDDVHETTGPLSTLGTESYLTAFWLERGLLDAFRDDYRRRRAFPGVATWPSPLALEDQLDSYIGQQSVAWLEHYTGEQPFLLWAAFGAPHPPFDAPAEYASMYDEAEIPAAAPPADIPAWAPRHVATFLSHSRAYDPAVLRAARAQYARKISLVDYWFGRLLAVLERRGMLEDTCILFFSDHGDMLGEQGRMGKGCFFEPAVRIPLILRYPALLPQGRTIEAPVELIDCFPTLLDIGGAEPSGSAFGRSLVPVASGATTEHRSPIFSELNRHVMVFDGRHKYTVDGQAGGYMLYALQADPGERRNLIGHPDVAALERQLREQLLEWLVRTQVVLTWPANSAE